MRLKCKSVRRRALSHILCHIIIQQLFSTNQSVVGNTLQTPPTISYRTHILSFDEIRTDVNVFGIQWRIILNDLLIMIILSISRFRYSVSTIIHDTVLNARGYCGVAIRFFAYSSPVTTLKKKKKTFCNIRIYTNP